MTDLRKLRKQALKEYGATLSKLSVRLTIIQDEEIPTISGKRPIKVWRSRSHLVQLWQEDDPAYPGMLRLSVCRTRLRPDGQWEDGLTWDELHAIKSEVGYADWYAVEVYPPVKDVQNIANFRHLWLLPQPLSIGFRRQG